MICSILAYLIPLKTNQSFRCSEWPFIAEGPTFTPTLQPQFDSDEDGGSEQAWEVVGPSPPKFRSDFLKDEDGLPEPVEPDLADTSTCPLIFVGPVPNNKRCKRCDSWICGGCVAYSWNEAGNVVWFHHVCMLPELLNHKEQHAPCLERLLSISTSTNLNPAAQCLVEESIDLLCALNDADQDINDPGHPAKRVRTSYWDATIPDTLVDRDQEHDHVQETLEDAQPREL